MDHHCPWLRRCIGYQNYKYFFVFLAYTVAALGFTSITLTLFALQELRSDPTSLACFCLVLIVAIVAFLFVIVSAFTSFHLYIAGLGMTTLESMEKRSKKGVPRRDYNQGWYKNMQVALGANPLLWFLPVYPPDGDGGTFVYTEAAQAPLAEQRGDGSGYSALVPPPAIQPDSSTLGVGIVDYDANGGSSVCPCVKQEKGESMTRTLSKDLSKRMTRQMTSTLTLEIDVDSDQDDDENTRSYSPIPITVSA